MEYSSYGVSATPGQLWRNVRTGDVLFVYKNRSRLEGMFCDGRRMSDMEILNLNHGANGWKCVYLDKPSEVEYDTD